MKRALPWIAGGGLVLGLVAVAVVAWLRPPTLDDCAELADVAQADVCRQKALQRDDLSPDEILRAVAASKDPETRDLLRIQVVVLDPERSLDLCPVMEGAQARTWCETLEGRSHLWLTGEGVTDKVPNGTRRKGEGRGSAP